MEEDHLTTNGHSRLENGQDARTTESRSAHSKGGNLSSQDLCELEGFLA